MIRKMNIFLFDSPTKNQESGRTGPKASRSDGSRAGVVLHAMAKIRRSRFHVLAEQKDREQLHPSLPKGDPWFNSFQ